MLYIIDDCIVLYIYRIKKTPNNLDINYIDATVSLVFCNNVTLLLDHNVYGHRNNITPHAVILFIRLFNMIQVKKSIASLFQATNNRSICTPYSSIHVGRAR